MVLLFFQEWGILDAHAISHAQKDNQDVQGATACGQKYSLAEGDPYRRPRDQEIRNYISEDNRETDFFSALRIR